MFGSAAAAVAHLSRTGPQNVQAVTMTAVGIAQSLNYGDDWDFTGGRSDHRFKFWFWGQLCGAAAEFCPCYSIR